MPEGRTVWGGLCPSSVISLAVVGGWCQKSLQYLKIIMRIKWFGISKYASKVTGVQ